MSDFPSNASTTSTEGTTSTMENAKNTVYDSKVSYIRQSIQ